MVSNRFLALSFTGLPCLFHGLVLYIEGVIHQYSYIDIVLIFPICYLLLYVDDIVLSVMLLS